MPLDLTLEQKMWLSLVAVDLSENALYKTLEVFETLACLGPHLKKVDLSGNSLAGEVPDCAGQLIALEELYMSNNQLVSISSEAAAGWTNLTRLKINRNGTTPFSVPTKLHSSACTNYCFLTYLVYR